MDVDLRTSSDLETSNIKDEAIGDPAAPVDNVSTDSFQVAPGIVIDDETEKPESGRKSFLTESSNSSSTSNPDITELQLERNFYTLTSGDVLEVPVSTIDSSGQITSAERQYLQCQILEGSSESVRLFNACEIAGLRPGEVKIQLQYISPDVELTGPVLEINVEPVKVSIAENALNFQIESWQSELWFSYSGLRNEDFYHAILSSAMAGGVALDVVPNMQNFKTVCSNTIPVNANRVACYFQAESENAWLVVNNKVQGAFNGHVELASTSNKVSPTVSYTREGSVVISLDEPVRQFVYANEMGTNNSNFYRLRENLNPPEVFKVSITDYTYPVKLSVKWDNGVCVSSMIIHTRNKIYCELPATALGSLFIEIEGNNDTTPMSSPAAVDGGTFYTLNVEKI